MNRERPSLFFSKSKLEFGGRDRMTNFRQMTRLQNAIKNTYSQASKGFFSHQDLYLFLPKERKFIKQKDLLTTLVGKKICCYQKLSRNEDYYRVLEP